MSQLAYLDCETSGLDPDAHQIWEVALIVDDEEFVWRLPIDLSRADPVALNIGRYFEREHDKNFQDANDVWKPIEHVKSDQVGEWCRRFAKLTWGRRSRTLARGDVVSDPKRSEQIERMRLWFVSQLPEHDVGGWYFETQPHATVVVDEGRWRSIGGRYGVGMLAGHGTCQRCGKRFELPRWGNFAVYDDTTDFEKFPTLKLEAKVEAAKEWVLGEARRDGKCWGDIPEVGGDGPRVVMG